MTAEKDEIDRIVAAVKRSFATMCGGDNSGDSPVFKAMADRPLSFAAGVGVRKVVEFVLAQVALPSEAQGASVPWYTTIGTPVQTLSANPDVTGWSEVALISRRWGVRGTVVGYSDGHGPTVQVRHDDGTHSWYDPSEIAPL